MNPMLDPPHLEGIKKALFIQPHPDDNEIGAGGTILRLAAAGCEVHCLTVTDGRLGTEFCSLPPEELARARAKEVAAATALEGAVNEGFLGFEDQTEAGVSEVAAKIAEVIDRVQPDAVFTCDPNLRDEWHPDHLLTGRALAPAVWRAKHKPQIFGYYFTDRPNTALDVTPYLEKKMSAIACHKTQTNEQFLGMLSMFYAAMSEGTGFGSAERLRVFGTLHTHCWPFELNSIAY